MNNTGVTDLLLEFSTIRADCFLPSSPSTLLPSPPASLETDTQCSATVLGTGDIPDREPRLQDLVEQMSQFPEDTVFFLDTWCFRWEYVVKEVARFFNESVHVDRYKRSIHTAIETDPRPLMCTATNAHSTRFHACERTHKSMACRRFESGNRKPVYNLDKRIAG
ncbi:hypothetical protein V866_006069 [Kwoniella sp. B9012]